MTIETDVALQLILLGVSAGAMVTMAVAMLRAERPMARWTGVVFDLGVAAYTFKLINDATHVLPMWAMVPVCALAAGTVGWFWLFMMSLFEDTCQTRPVSLAVVGLMTATGLAGMYGEGPLSNAAWLSCNLLQVGCALHALSLIIRGWKGDLVEARRNVRGPFLLGCTIYIIALRGLEVADNFGAAPDWYPMANAVALALVCVSGAFVFLDARADLFGFNRTARTALAPAPEIANDASAAEPAPGFVPVPVNAMDRATRADLDRLEKLMSVDEVWRQEGLSVASLALKVGVSETQLRRLISDHLGFRNFPSFVNARRIAAARCRLSDPHEARVSISTIAFDLGFASLGPFNRAFREATGKPPSEWRREALNGAFPPDLGVAAQPPGPKIVAAE
jgi:AraC-like DNA-binding protein